MHGLRITVVIDNGPNFTSHEFQQFLKGNGSKHVIVSPYHPASNGQAERAIPVFKEGIEKMKEGTMRTKLSRFLLKYRITPHTTTGVAPAELLMKRRLQMHLDQIQPKEVERVEDKQWHQKKAHDQHVKERIIKTGDHVSMRDFRKPKAWLEGVVLKLTGSVSAQIRLENGQTMRRHLDHICKCYLKPQEENQNSEAHDQVILPFGEAPLHQPNVDQPEQPGLIPPVEDGHARRQLPGRECRVPQHLQDYELGN